MCLLLLITEFASIQKQEIPAAHNEAYQFNSLMIYENPAYEKIRGNRTGAVNM